MRQPVNKYQYEITDRLGSIEFGPLGEADFTIEYDRVNDGRLDYDTTMPSTITITGEAYQKMLKIEQSIYRCEYATITVKRACYNEINQISYIPFFTGRLSNNSGDWDLDKCTLKIKVDSIKPNQCFEDNKSNEIDLLFEITDRYIVKLNSPGVEVETVEYTRTSDLSGGDCTTPYWEGVGNPMDGGWIYYEWTAVENRAFVPSHCDMTTKWAREVVTLPCGTPSPGPEWILVEDLCPTGTQKWARPARRYGCIFISPDDLGASILTTSYICKVVGLNEGDSVIQIDNGLKMEDVVDTFMEQFCPDYSFVSNFLQIHPEIVSDTNYVTGQPSKTNHLLLFQKSDVKRPNVSNDATKALMSFETLFNFFVEAYNMRWKIEGTTIRFEHVSYFTKDSGFDLTLPKYADFVKAIRHYSYDNTQIPSREEYKWMEAGVGDFQGVPIIYDECQTQVSRSNKKTHALDKFTTDIELCLSNPDSDSSNVSDDGFVVIACNEIAGELYVITEASILTTGSHAMNNSLAWAQLHRDYHKYDRPLKHGNMNNVDTTFFSVKPTKKGEKITIPLCCDDLFLPENTIKTALGIGIVDKASYSFRDNTLSLELLYDAISDLVNNNAPVAINDVVTTVMDTPIAINVISNDTDSDGTIERVEISVHPMNGTVVVNPDKTITYTPDSGYTGDDYFTYQIFDDWNEGSNIALVAIIITPGNTAPIAIDDNYSTNKNTALTIAAPGVFANDTDDTSFSLDTYDATSAHGGTVSMGTGGGFTYTPPTGFVGFDTFTYTITDGTLTDTGTVTIEVRDPNNPVANDDGIYATRKNTNYTLAAPGVLANDTTTIGTLTAVAGTFTTVQGGSVVLNSDGSLVYTPPTGFVGIDSVNYTVSNGTGTDTGIINFRVLPDIYVKIQTVETANEIEHTLCSESGIIETGWITKNKFTLFFYSNSAGTTPFDVTSLGLVVNIKNVIVENGGTPSEVFTTENPTSGTSWPCFGGSFVETSIEETDCFGTDTYTLSRVITVDPGLYTVI